MDEKIRVYEHIMPLYKELVKDVGSLDHCIFHSSSRNRNRSLQGVEESYLVTGCKYLCAGEPFNGLPILCPDYMTMRGMFEELKIDISVLEEVVSDNKGAINCEK